jgi:Cellulase (glycosyl hydrolase family 5)
MRTQTFGLNRFLRNLIRSLYYSCFFVLPITASAVQPGEQTKGLFVKNGILMRQGKPYVGIGANYDSLFGRLLQNKDDNSSLENLALLANKGIPFVRFRACGFWPQNGQLYLNDRAEYFRRMDQVVHCAEQHHIGLIPSLFWRLATVNELLGENRDRLADPTGKSTAFIRQYTREMVLRYKDSPAIWGWEFGNEANLGVDNPTQRRGAGEGSGLSESGGGGKLSTADLRTIYVAFGNVVRSIDPVRVIDSGTTIPRPAAWHNAHGQPRQRDSESQSYAMLLAQNPDPINILSVHIYQKSQKLSPFGPETVGHFISRYSKFATESGKPLFIGEFPTRNREQTQEYLKAIEDNHVPLSAFWVFDNKKQEATMNVTFSNERSFVIDMIAEANKIIRGNR